MIISVVTTPVEAVPTETPGIILKVESAFIRMCEKQKKKKLNITYSCDVVLSVYEVKHFHN